MAVAQEGRGQSDPQKQQIQTNNGELGVHGQVDIGGLRTTMGRGVVEANLSLAQDDRKGNSPTSINTDHGTAKKDTAGEDSHDAEGITDTAGDNATNATVTKRKLTKTLFTSGADLRSMALGEAADLDDDDEVTFTEMR